MATSFQVTFDCANPAKLSEFWAIALDYKIQEPPPGFESWPAFLKAQNVPEEKWDSASAAVDPEGKGPRLFFQKVPEGKTVKNRVHLDVNVGGGHGTPVVERRQRVNRKIEQLTGAGATRVSEYNEMGEFWVVMRDPEGNEFCLQ
jgi:hypothetical protein